jgi:hypothetical protein
MLHYNECCKRKCDWIGLDSELVDGPMYMCHGIETRDIVCPKCGNNEYYTVKIMDACQVAQKDRIWAVLSLYNNSKKDLLECVELARFRGCDVKQNSYANLTAKLNSLAKKGVLFKLTAKGSLALYKFPEHTLNRLIDEVLLEKLKKRFGTNISYIKTVDNRVKYRNHNEGRDRWAKFSDLIVCKEES